MVNHHALMVGLSYCRIDGVDFGYAWTPMPKKTLRPARRSNWYV